MHFLKVAKAVHKCSDSIPTVSDERRMSLCCTYTRFRRRRAGIQYNSVGQPKSIENHGILVMSPADFLNFLEVRKGIPEVTKHYLSGTRQLQTASAL